MTQNHISNSLSIYFKVFEHQLSKPQFSHFKAWNLGLLHAKPHGSEIAGQFSEKHETSLTRFQSNSNWNHDQVNLTRINHATNIVSLPSQSSQSDDDSDEQVCYIIDDTVNEKYGKQLPGSRYLWSNTAKRTVWGQNLVSSHMQIGDIDLPLFASLYHKENGKSKIDLALHQLSQFPPTKNGQIGVLLVDTWFGCKKVIKEAKSRNLETITMLKSNRLIKPQGLEQWISISQIASKLRRSGLRRVKVENTRYRFAQLEGTIKGFNDETFKILIVQQYLAEKRKWSKYKYLLSTDPSMKPWMVLHLYRKRWTIEVFYKFAKERLCLAKSRAMSEQAWLRFVLLLYCAYTYLSLSKSEISVFYSGQDSYYKAQKQIIEDCRTQLISWVYIQGQEGRPLKEILLIMGLIEKSA